MAQRGGVVTDAKVARDDCEKRGRIAQSFRRGQMNGVQSADRFHGKGASGASEDRFGDARDVATPGKPLESEEYCPGYAFGGE